MSVHGANPAAPLLQFSPPAAASDEVTSIEKQMGEDMITEILLRLPVKSLLRFKAVCKFWRSLISDPHFAISHFERATPRLVFTTIPGYGSIRTMDIERPLHPDHISEPINLDFLSPHLDYNFIEGSCRGFLLNLDGNFIDGNFIEGSCRGFLLMSFDHHRSLYVLNPSTHVHKQIPVDTNAINHLYGFGYDSSKDDYLVVQLPFTDSFAPNLAHVQFFSMRANMWKYIEGVDLPPLIAIETVEGLLFNEAIHWPAWDSVPGGMNFIIAFDLIEKRLLEIPQPDGLDANGFALWVHGRFFSLSVMQRDTIEIWAMKKYKVQSSWTKTLVLSLEHFCHPPLCSTKGGDIVMFSGTKLTKCSDEGIQGEEQLENFNDFGFLSSFVPLYTESMLSLPNVSE